MDNIRLEAGKYYRTRDGRKAYVGAQNPFQHKHDYAFIGTVDGAENVFSWSEYGQYFGSQTSRHDLVAEWKEPKRINGWVALWEHGGLVAGCSHVYATKEEAKRAAFAGVKAYVKIDVLEGQGLDGSAR